MAAKKKDTSSSPYDVSMTSIVLSVPMGGEWVVKLRHLRE
jgi:hypothetical protein